MDAPVETLAELDGGVWDEVLGPSGPNSRVYLARGGGGAHKVVLSWVLVATKESVCPQLLSFF